MGMSGGERAEGAAQDIGMAGEVDAGAHGDGEKFVGVEGDGVSLLGSVEEGAEFGDEGGGSAPGGIDVKPEVVFAGDGKDVGDRDRWRRLRWCQRWR